jgi:hypothetical protein
LQQKVLEKRTELAEPHHNNPPEQSNAAVAATTVGTTTTTASTTSSTTAATSTAAIVGDLVLVHQTLPDLESTEPAFDINFVGKQRRFFLRCGTHLRPLISYISIDEQSGYLSYVLTVFFYGFPTP